MNAARILLPLLLLATTALSGCIWGCEHPTLIATWEQEDLSGDRGRYVDYTHGGHRGTLHWGGNQAKLLVNDLRAGDEGRIIAFAEAMFEEFGWPEPRIREGTIVEGCNDAL